jgi:two-component system sensor histidine kinase DesK
MLGWLNRKPDSAAYSDANDFGAGVIDFRHDVESAADGSGFRSSKRTARLILLTVLGCYAAVEIINAVSSQQAHGTVVPVSLASLFVLLSLQVVISFQVADDWPLLWRVGMLLAMGLVTYLPLLALGSEWGGMAGWLAGSVLLLLPGRIAWTLFGAVVLSMFLGSVLFNLDVFSIAYLTLVTVTTGLVVFGLSRLSLSISYLQDTRTELAQLAVIRERMRFARDLHDLLGYSLSAITLKAEFTRRMVGGNPERARDELAELLDIARQALADVRLVASGYRNMSLSKEATEVASLLSTAGINARVEINCGPLDEELDTALATVLREAVTNMLRHSSAQNCTIQGTVTSGAVSLQVSNDGVPATAASEREGGGLQNLALRMNAVGGKLNVNRYDDRFEVLATAPLPALGHFP